MKLKGKYVFGVIYIILLFSFTLYVLLDTFVISKKITLVKTEEQKEKEEDSNNFYSEDFSYEDENIKVKVSKYNKYETNIYVADIIINDPKYLKTAFAFDIYGKNLIDKTSVIAREHNAIIAINGDYYGIKEKGYVLRNGVVYRDTFIKKKQDLVIYEDGNFDIIREDEVNVYDLQKKGVYNLLSFGPGLLKDGEIIIKEDQDITNYKMKNPRTAIGIVENLHYVFVVCDGRVREKQGLYLYELAQFLKDLGVKTAYNLDGGGTTSMAFNGKVVNDLVRERSVSDIIYVGY